MYSKYHLYLYIVDKHLKIEELHLVDFKNYHQLNLNFKTNLVGFTGENGEGKTNILDAIYYLCTTKSYFNSVEKYNFRYETEGMLLQAVINKSDRQYRSSIKVQKGRKKEISLNQVREEKAFEYVGKFPIVMIAPDDNMIIIGGSIERRKMMDNAMCQSDVTYMRLLIQYNKILSNRNALLKQMADNPTLQYDLLDTFDAMLSNVAEQIFIRREVFIKKFSERFEETYNYISQGKEQIKVEYKSHLYEGDLSKLLLSQRNKDLILQRTTRGIHLDDLELTLDDYQLKRVGSQGQLKTYVVSMKLALYNLLAEEKGVMPILLLDDIFEKFDDVRIRQLFSILSEIKIGQVFVTDTNEDRIREVMNLASQDYEIFRVNNNYVEKKE